MTGCPTTMCYLQEYTGDSPLLCVKVGFLDVYYHTLQLRKQRLGQDNQFTLNLQQPVISECICLSRSTQQQQQKSMAATLWYQPGLAGSHIALSTTAAANTLLQLIHSCAFLVSCTVSCGRSVHKWTSWCHDDSSCCQQCDRQCSMSWWH